MNTAIEYSVPSGRRIHPASFCAVILPLPSRNPVPVLCSMMLPAGSGFFNWLVPVWQFTSAFHTEWKYSPDSILPFANRWKRAATSVGVAELPLMAEGLRCMSSSVTETSKLLKPALCRNFSVFSKSVFYFIVNFFQIFIVKTGKSNIIGSFSLHPVLNSLRFFH